MKIKKPVYYEIYRKLRKFEDSEDHTVDSETGELLPVDYSEHLWMTVLTFADVLNFWLKDAQMTNGVYDYSFKEFYLCPKRKSV